MKTTFACKNCGKMEVVDDTFATEDKLVVVNDCHRCHDKAVVDSALNAKFSNLCRVIIELNAWDFALMDDGDVLGLESMYRFKFKFDDRKITIWDKNEAFHINLDDEIRATCYHASKEFGVEYKTPASEVEEVIGKFRDALKQDLKHDVVIEWEDSVVLSACL